MNEWKKTTSNTNHTTTLQATQPIQTLNFVRRSCHINVELYHDLFFYQILHKVHIKDTHTHTYSHNNSDANRIIWFSANVFGFCAYYLNGATALDMCHICDSMLHWIEWRCFIRFNSIPSRMVCGRRSVYGSIHSANIVFCSFDCFRFQPLKAHVFVYAYVLVYTICARVYVVTSLVINVNLFHQV